MHRTWFISCSVLALFLCWSQSTEAAEVRLGVAQESFVLPNGVPLAGYSRRKGRPSRGLHDPVGARAVVLDDGRQTVALVSCDLLIIDEVLYEAMRAAVRQRGLPADLLLVVASTHTHSGPGAYGHSFFEKLSMGHFDQTVFDAIVQSTAEAVARAYESARGPVEIAVGEALTEGLVQNRVEAGGVVDASLRVVAFYHPGTRTPQAIILNFSAHPTTLGAWNWELSADYPGVLRREVERRFPGATALFLAGAVADQAPVKSGNGFKRSEWIGLVLAERAAEVIEQMRPMPLGMIHGASEIMRLPPARLRLGRVVMPQWLGQRFVDNDATLSLVRAGDVVFAGAPCDFSTVLSKRLAQAGQAQRLHVITVGFANDYIGYCIPEALYGAQEYESSMAFNGPNTGELITDRLIQMLKSVTSDE